MQLSALSCLRFSPLLRLSHFQSCTNQYGRTYFDVESFLVMEQSGQSSGTGRGTRRRAASRKYSSFDQEKRLSRQRPHSSTPDGVRRSSTSVRNRSSSQYNKKWVVKSTDSTVSSGSDSPSSRGHRKSFSRKPRKDSVRLEYRPKKTASVDSDELVRPHNSKTEELPPKKRSVPSSYTLKTPAEIEEEEKGFHPFERSVAICDLPKKIRSLVSAEEYNYLDDQAWKRRAMLGPATASYKSALHPLNQAKNRYRNVLAVEDSRVILYEDRQGSDYVNANWIPGAFPGQKHRFIATQGPLDNTVVDFWRMVWQTEVSVIVMLARTIESGRPKCHRYWPEQGEPALLFDITTDDDSFQLQVSLESERDMHSRLTNLSNMKDNRLVTHLQHVDWPDHGVPDTTDEFLELASAAQQQSVGDAPILVHCSAGIGRTGSFTLIENVLEKLWADLSINDNQMPYVNLAQELLRLRKQRDGMVQTEEQYLFCWRCVLHAVEEHPVAKKFLNPQ